MSGGGITEGIVEQAALDWFRSLGYAILPGAVLAPGGTAPERSSYDQVVLTGRRREAALRINPDLPGSVAEQAVTRLLRAEPQNALAENERVHQLLTGGVPVEHRTVAGEIRTALVWLVDWEEPTTNDWLVVPVHRRRGWQEPSGRRRSLPQRAADRLAGAEEPRRCARHPARRVESGPDLPPRHPGAVHAQRHRRHLRRDGPSGPTSRAKAVPGVSSRDELSRADTARAGGGG